MPFSLDRMEFDLAPGASAQLNIQFDPGMRTDRQCTKVKHAIEVQYRDHPQRDRIPLLGNIFFPNVQFDRTAVDFGCILNDTSRSLTVTMTNTSPCVAEYQWALLDDFQEKTLVDGTMKEGE